MLVHKCDKCKKTIPGSKRRSTISVDAGYDNYEFCPACGNAIAKILKSYKLKVTEV